MATIERTDHLTELRVEAIDADGMKCSECGDVGPRDKLLIYTTMRGRQPRTHNGQFCSKLCHDIFHGLKPRRSN